MFGTNNHYIQVMGVVMRYY